MSYSQANLAKVRGVSLKRTIQGFVRIVWIEDNKGNYVSNDENKWGVSPTNSLKVGSHVNSKNAYIL